MFLSVQKIISNRQDYRTQSDVSLKTDEKTANNLPKFLLFIYRRMILSNAGPVVAVSLNEKNQVIDYNLSNY